MSHTARIVDIIGQFQGTRPRRAESRIKRLVIHHDACDVPKMNQAAVLARLKQYNAQHRSHGWGRIGYHYCIPHFPDIVYKINPVTWNTVHAAGANADGVGIMLMGNFMETVPTDFQLDALEWLLKQLKASLPGPLSVISHRNVRHKTDCPGELFTEAQIRTIARGAGLPKD
jgi:hypothetical protein